MKARRKLPAMAAGLVGAVGLAGAAYDNLNVPKNCQLPKVETECVVFADHAKDWRWSDMYEQCDLTRIEGAQMYTGKGPFTWLQRRGVPSDLQDCAVFWTQHEAFTEEQIHNADSLRVSPTAEQRVGQWESCKDGIADLTWQAGKVYTILIPNKHKNQAFDSATNTAYAPVACKPWDPNCGGKPVKAGTTEEPTLEELIDTNPLVKRVQTIKGFGGKLKGMLIDDHDDRTSLGISALFGRDTHELVGKNDDGQRKYEHSEFEVEGELGIGLEDRNTCDPCNSWSRELNIGAAVSARKEHLTDVGERGGWLAGWGHSWQATIQNISSRARSYWAPWFSRDNGPTQNYTHVSAMGLIHPTFSHAKTDDMVLDDHTTIRAPMVGVELQADHWGGRYMRSETDLNANAVVAAQVEHINYGEGQAYTRQQGTLAVKKGLTDNGYWADDYSVSLTGEADFVGEKGTGVRVRAGPQYTKFRNGQDGLGFTIGAWYLSSDMDTYRCSDLNRNLDRHNAMLQSGRERKNQICPE